MVTLLDDLEGYFGGRLVLLHQVLHRPCAIDHHPDGRQEEDLCALRLSQPRFRDLSNRERAGIRSSTSAESVT